MLERSFDVLEFCETQLNSDEVSGHGRNHAIVCLSNHGRKDRNGLAPIFILRKMKPTRRKRPSDQDMVLWLKSCFSSETFKQVICHSHKKSDYEK